MTTSGRSAPASRAESTQNRALPVRFAELLHRDAAEPAASIPCEGFEREGSRYPDLVSVGRAEFRQIERVHQTGRQSAR